MNQAHTMPRRTLLILVSIAFVGTALSGCFGTDADANVIDGSQLPTFSTTLFLNQVMFHPYPGGMQSAWVFSERIDSSTFEIPIFRVTEGQMVEITFRNTFDFNHTIHWHGLDVPFEMDGVPYLTQEPIQPGEEFTYRFQAKPEGTHFFHCHVDTKHHLDMGMYGVIIVAPASGERYPYDSEDLMVLDDWDSSHLHQNNADAEMTVNSLTDDSGSPSSQVDRTEDQVDDILTDPSNQPGTSQVNDAAPGTVPKSVTREKRDWYPETFAPWNPSYDTWTINGKSFPWTDPIPITQGETKRIRMVNVGNDVFVMHMHGHHFDVTHKDGYPLPAPIRADTWPIHPGERYSIMMEANNPGAWLFHDHSGKSANNFISPGGAMTSIVYEDFETEQGGGHDHGQIRSMSAGDFLGLYV